MTRSRTSKQSSLARVWRLIVALSLVVAIIGPGLAAAPPAAAVTLSGVRGVVSVSGGLNLRTSPSWSASIIRTLNNGTAIQIRATSGDWFKVTVGRSTGWVNSWYVRLTGTPSVTIARGNTSHKMVALTFDAGSDLGYTQTIIETLEREGIPASFGLKGDWIDDYPGYAAWIAADGFEIINHTLHHPSYTGASTGSGSLSPARRLSQLEATETRTKRVNGTGSKPYWRPPYGDYDSGVLRDVGADGYAYTIMWSIDSLGWDGLTARQITSRVLNNTGNGSIILMHVGSDSQDGVALPAIIRGLRARGYTFGTVSDVIR